MTRSLFAVLLFWSATAFGSDAYILRFLQRTGRSALCHRAVWTSDVLFYNRTAADAAVRLVSISNGEMPDTIDRVLQLPPGQLIAMGRLSPRFDWTPRNAGNEQVWVMHVDIPEGVTVESRNEVSDDEYCSAEHRDARGPVGKVSMPVITKLTPPGLPQVTLGTDLVSEGSRTNVIIYNDGSATATATIQVRRGCDDTLLGQQIVTIPAHTARQFGGFSNDVTTLCPSPARAEHYVRYTVVTVDQPSFGIVSTLTESQQPSVGDITPLIELAVAFNMHF